MKRLALCGWAADCGVGRELMDAAANLKTCGVFVIPHKHKPNRLEAVPEDVRYVSGKQAPALEMRAFIEKAKPDVILTWETPGDWRFPSIWKEKGIRWVNVIHWDWFPTERIDILRQADLVAPYEGCRRGLEGVGLKSEILPVPIDVRNFPFKQRRVGKVFGMAYGAGGPFGRRSLKEVLDALERMPEAPPFVVKAQKDCKEYRLIRNTALVLKNSENPADVYADVDVMIQPSKFEGVGLSLLEAQATGAPVITVDAEPMKTLAPDLRVPVVAHTEVSTVKGNKVDAFIPSTSGLEEVIRSLFGKDIGELSLSARKNAERFAWERLRGKWESYLEVA